MVGLARPRCLQWVNLASAKKLCDKAQSKHQAVVRAYKARSLAHFPSLRGNGLRLSDNMVRNLVPEAGPFGRYQVLADFRALTSAQLVDLPDFFGHGASLVAMEQAKQIDHSSHTSSHHPSSRVLPCVVAITITAVGLSCSSLLLTLK